MNIVGIPLWLALTLLILIHAAKTRRDGLLPQPPEDFTPPTDIPPTAYSG